MQEQDSFQHAHQISQPRNGKKQLNFNNYCNNYWTRLSKISWIVRGEQINYRDTDKSRQFAITEFNNCFITRSPSLFSYFNHFLAAQESDLPFFSRERGSNCMSRISFPFRAFCVLKSHNFEKPIQGKVPVVQERSRNFWSTKKKSHGQLRV